MSRRLVSAMISAAISSSTVRAIMSAPTMPDVMARAFFGSGRRETVFDQLHEPCQCRGADLRKLLAPRHFRSQRGKAATGLRALTVIERQVA
jgi:hypothetical protein